MPHPILIFLTSMVFMGVIQLCGEARAQTPNTITNSIGMELMLIPKGAFLMGSPIEEVDRFIVEDQYHVTLTKDYYIGVTEVTQGQYKKVMGKNPSYFRYNRKNDSSMYPVERVSWEDAVEFCKKLSELPEEKAAGRVYRLPTEAEWEYACRGGTDTAFSFGDNSRFLIHYAWYLENSKATPNPRTTSSVGEKKANAFGLYDMHGNVDEWCSDYYDNYPKGPVSDPSGPREGFGRVLRGGSYNSEARYCRSAWRQSLGQSAQLSYIGFRVALSPSEIPK